MQKPNRTSLTLSKKCFDLNNDFEFFFGIWNFDDDLHFDPTIFHNSDGITCLHKKNFLLVSSTFVSETVKTSLICSDNIKDNSFDALLFRGYILEPPIHSLSEKDKILDYWRKGFNRRHNGIFSTVGINNNGKTLKMITDAFGISPLYYRKLGKAVVFASSPRFLSCEGDQQDLISWRCLMQSHFIPGDRSLSVNVERIPPGTILTFTGSLPCKKRWFDFTELPHGKLVITPGAVDEVEEAFSASMDRCLRLETSKLLLPLSSGYDSRRILGHLLKKDKNFFSVTVRGLDVQHRDVDAFFSAKMARDYNFAHQVYEMPTANILSQAEKTRRFCFDYESLMHSWYLPVLRKTNDITLVLDGLCGDTLGHSGLKISRMQSRYIPEHECIAKNLLLPNFESVLNKKIWPSHEQVVSEFIKIISPLPATNNLIDLVMIMHRARRAISISSQQFAKPGHIIVFPYMDLDYIQSILTYSPIDRFRKSFQAQCLKKYFFDIFNYPGSHYVPYYIKKAPPETKPTSVFLQEKLIYNQNLKNSKYFLPYLNQTRSLQYILFRKRKWFIKNSDWWIKSMLDFSDRCNRSYNCIKKKSA
jgi:hypothetical protein